CVPGLPGEAGWQSADPGSDSSVGGHALRPAPGLHLLLDLGVTTSTDRQPAELPAGLLGVLQSLLPRLRAGDPGLSQLALDLGGVVAHPQVLLDRLLRVP